MKDLTFCQVVVALLGIALAAALLAITFCGCTTQERAAQTWFEQKNYQLETEPLR